MVITNLTAKDDNDSSTDTTPIQVVEDFQEVAGDDINVDFVATQVLISTKRKNQFQEEPVLQTSLASTTFGVGVSTASPLSPTREWRATFNKFSG